MATQPQPDPQQGFHAPTHGNWAQWAAVILALMLGVSNTALTLYFHNTEAASKTSDEHSNALIDAKLGPADEKMHNDLREQLAPISGQLKDLSEKLLALDGRIAKLEGRFDQLTEDQKRSERLQLNRLSDQITTAQRSGRKIDPQTVSALGQDLLKIAESPTNSNRELAWKVVNATMGYYTSVVTVDLSRFWRLSNTDQAHACIDVSKANAWSFEHVVLDHCTQTLDSLIGLEPVGRHIHFRDLAFKDAHLIYNGGPLEMDNVYFVNCTFEFHPNRPTEQFAETLFANGHIPHFSAD
jgi:hypothetical protein